MTKATALYDTHGQRLTNCCGCYSTYCDEDLCCKRCYGTVSDGQGDGTEYKVKHTEGDTEDALEPIGGETP